MAYYLPVLEEVEDFDFSTKEHALEQVLKVKINAMGISSFWSSTHQMDIQMIE